jgi:hypothetical protein
MLIYVKIFWGKSYGNICLHLFIECKWLDIFFLLRWLKQLKNNITGQIMVSQWHYSLHTKYIFSLNVIYRYTSRRSAFHIYLYFLLIFLIKIFAQINNFARLWRKKIWLRKIKQYNTYVKLDIEWNISDFICKEK